MAVWSALGGVGLDFGSIIKLPELVLILFKWSSYIVLCWPLSV